MGEPKFAIVPRDAHSTIRYDDQTALFYLTLPKTLVLRSGDVETVSTGLRLISPPRVTYEYSLAIMHPHKDDVTLLRSPEETQRNGEIEFQLKCDTDLAVLLKSSYAIKMAVYTRVRFKAKCTRRGGRAHHPEPPDSSLATCRREQARGQRIPSS